MDFTPRTESLLDRAQTLCTSRGARMTGLRREVLGLVLDSPAPVGAYDLLDRLGRRGAPPTIYRALDFLREQGLVHRIEKLSAFVGCIEEADHAHAAQFLICRDCGRATEIESLEIAAALAHAAAASGFAIDAATVEAEGHCADCRAGDHPAVAVP